MIKIIQHLLRWFRGEIRERTVLRECGSLCYCPACDDILNDQAEWDELMSSYTCRCGAVTYWDLDTPVPLLLD
jgi:hypothetical protein